MIRSARCCTKLLKVEIWINEFFFLRSNFCFCFVKFNLHIFLFLSLLNCPNFFGQNSSNGYLFCLKSSAIYSMHYHRKAKDSTSNQSSINNDFFEDLPMQNNFWLIDFQDRMKDLNQFINVGLSVVSSKNFSNSLTGNVIDGEASLRHLLISQIMIFLLVVFQSLISLSNEGKKKNWTLHRISLRAANLE